MESQSVIVMPIILLAILGAAMAAAQASPLLEYQRQSYQSQRAPSTDNKIIISTTTTTTTTAITSKQLETSNYTAAASDVERILMSGARCAQLASCRNQKGRRLELDSGADKRGCYCDRNCRHYQDCCLDSPFASSLEERLRMGAGKLEEARLEWHCHRINAVFGDVLLRASCPKDWLASDEPEAELVARRCAYVKDRGKRLAPEYVADPLGMMMPITDVHTGTTYANSHCVRCHRPQAPKLSYWLPLLECNYNLDTDDRNQLFDLISAKRGRALQFSAKRNRWIVQVPANLSSDTIDHQSENTSVPSTNEDLEQSQRVCSVSTTVPDSLEHLIRFCRRQTRHTCPEGGASSYADLQRARLECQFGHQALVYAGERVYHNLACARCNNETKVSCEPRSTKGLPMGHSGTVPIDQQRPNGTTIELQGPPAPDEEDNGGVAPGAWSDNREQGPGGRSGAPIYSSFTLLMDLSGAAQGGEQVGAVHQCPDPLGQVYDPFYLACRDIVCGFGRHFREGRCVSADRLEQFRADLVAKFKPFMGQLTRACLAVSILSLATYLLLHALASLDLRPLLVAMAQWERLDSTSGAVGQSPLGRPRDSKASSNSSAGRTQSLSSRGVACLASSLLCAYLLFLLGHQQPQPGAEEPPTGKATGTCLSLAVATYFCFLVAFHWMLLLSYDIWRTLRLATCHLRAPATHSQSARFLSYAFFALISSGLVVGSALALDLLPLTCTSAGTTTNTTSNSIASAQQHQMCAPLDKPLGRLLHELRPKFGQRVGSCWFSNRRALALFFGAPIALIMLLNLLFFLHSSFMVIRTSAGSSRSSKSHKLPPQPMANQQQEQDFSFQNSLTNASLVSAQTLQSHLSMASTGSSSSCEGSIGDESPPPPQEQPASERKRKLESSESSASLATNRSVGQNSLAASLAHKYDALGCLVGTIAKDYRLYCRLCTIMGLTWLTGLVASLVDQSQLLWYLFVVLNTLQGLFIFIAFGCKHSKLANLRVLVAYARARWRRPGAAKTERPTGALP